MAGVSIQVERLEYTPTRTILYLGEDQANTAWLKSLKFWFEDQSGRRYNDKDGSSRSVGDRIVSSTPPPMGRTSTSSTPAGRPVASPLVRSTTTWGASLSISLAAER